MTDGDFVADLIISQDNAQARVVAQTAWIDASPSESYLQVQIPRDQSRRASEGTATMQLVFKWNGGLEVEVARQAVEWTRKL